MSSQNSTNNCCDNTVTVYDYTIGETINIPINQKLTLIQNAQEYYKKSKSKQIEVQKNSILLNKANDILNKIKYLYDKYNTITSLDELNKYLNNIKQTLKIDNNKNDNKNIFNFRIIDLGNQFKLYIGKNAANNDLLTTKFAKQNDLWLHARSVSGSHCVVPLRKNQKIPKEIIEKAASIAAYYSRARNSQLVPVAFAPKKYVRKPKGAPAGTVIMHREEVILVRPYNLSE